MQARYALPAAAAEPVLRAIGAGLSMVWRDITLRTCMLYWAICAFVVGGLTQVGLPVLADTRLQGAAALGLLLAVSGAGSLLGMTLTGMLCKIRVRTFGVTILLADGVSGLLLLPMGLVDATWQAAVLLVLLGVLGGCMQVAVFSWIQQRVPRAMLGRAMSIFMFIFMALAPLSAALTGFLLEYLSLAQLFGGAGVFLVGYALLDGLFTQIPRISDADAADQA